MNSTQDTAPAKLSPEAMLSDQTIAERLLAECLDAGHKPGKVQFTKYLYQLDYCHWRFTGKKATDMPWKFYHYGPWCDEAEACMAGLARQYGFGWREEESALIHSVAVAKPEVGVLIAGLISRIVDLFKDKDLNTLLNTTYFDTEPMLRANRGDLLDFSAVPVTKSFPQYYPSPTNVRPFQIPAARLKKMEEFRAKWPRLKAKAMERMALRNTPEYLEAMDLLSKELGTDEVIPGIKLRITPAAAEGLRSA